MFAGDLIDGFSFSLYDAALRNTVLNPSAIVGKPLGAGSAFGMWLTAPAGLPNFDPGTVLITYPCRHDEYPTSTDKERSQVGYSCGTVFCVFLQGVVLGWDTIQHEAVFDRERHDLIDTRKHFGHASLDSMLDRFGLDDEGIRKLCREDLLHHAERVHGASGARRPWNVEQFLQSGIPRIPYSPEMVRNLVSDLHEEKKLEGDGTIGDDGGPNSLSYLRPELYDDGNAARENLVSWVARIRQIGEDNEWLQKPAAASADAPSTVFHVEKLEIANVGTPGSPPALSSEDTPADPARLTWEDTPPLRISREAGSDAIRLKAKEYARALADLFRSVNGEFCFGLFGHWGRGKTYLMNLTASELQQSPDENWVVVPLSAWRYPTTPELWVHLYEEVAKQLLARGKVASPILAFRAALARLGPRPLITAALILCVALIPLWFKFLLVKVVVGLGLATGALAFARSMTKGFKKAHDQVPKRFLSLARHAEKLGLQGLIGEDLRSLLIGWARIRPNRIRQDRLGFRRWHAHAEALGFDWLKLSALVVLVGLATFLISPLVYDLGAALGYAGWVDAIHDMVADAFELRSTDRSKDTIKWMGGPGADSLRNLRWIFAKSWAILVLVLTLAALGTFRAQRKARVLLVVDDLDRCKPEDVIEIMSSIKLLLSDPEVEHRLLATMLVEEDMLRHHLMTHYKGVIKAHSGTDEDHQAWLDRFLRENTEKFLLAHLRLPQLDKSELREVFEGVLEEMEGVPEGSTVEGPRNGDRQSREVPSDADGVPATAPMKKRADGTPRPSKTFPLDGPVDLSDPLADIPTDPQAQVGANQDVSEKLREELQKIRGLLDGLASAAEDFGASPRSVRAFMVRYQLARLLLHHLGQAYDPELLAKALIVPSPHPIPDDALAQLDSTTRAIVDQVR